MAVQWDLALPRHDFGQIALAGFEQGKQMRRERETDNALAAYAQNQDDPNAVNALLRVNPRIGMQVQEQQRQRQMAAQQQQVTAGALRGDEGSMDALAGLNPEMWMKLDDRVKESVTRATNFMAQSGLQIGQLPEGQRGPAWESAVRQAESMGLDIPTQYERYSPQAFNAAMAEAGKMAEFLDSMKVEWKSVGEGGLIPVSAATGLRIDQGEAPVSQAVGVSSEDAGAILQGAAQAGKISKVDAIRITRSLGQNGDAKFQQWMRQNGVTVVDDAGTSPPPGFVLD